MLFYCAMTTKLDNERGKRNLFCGTVNDSIVLLNTLSMREETRQREDGVNDGRVYFGHSIVKPI